MNSKKLAIRKALLIFRALRIEVENCCLSFDQTDLQSAKVLSKKTRLELTKAQVKFQSWDLNLLQEQGLTQVFEDVQILHNYLDELIFRSESYTVQSQDYSLESSRLRLASFERTLDDLEDAYRSALTDGAKEAIDANAFRIFEAMNSTC